MLKKSTVKFCSKKSICIKYSLKPVSYYWSYYWNRRIYISVSSCKLTVNTDLCWQIFIHHTSFFICMSNLCSSRQRFINRLSILFIWNIIISVNYTRMLFEKRNFCPKCCGLAWFSKWPLYYIDDLCVIFCFKKYFFETI